MHVTYLFIRTLVMALSGVIGHGAFGQNTFVPLDSSLLDKTTFAQFVAGKETPVRDAPQSVVWTQQTKPDFRGAKYGAE